MIQLTSSGITYDEIRRIRDPRLFSSWRANTVHFVACGIEYDSARNVGRYLTMEAQRNDNNYPTDIPNYDYAIGQLSKTC